jgi:hypothetical protein
MIKFVSTYICVCTCMWISILSNLFLHIRNVCVYIHACGFRYDQIRFYRYMWCTCMWISILSNFVTLDICVCTVETNLIISKSTYIYICGNKYDIIEINNHVHTHIYVETNLIISKYTCYKQEQCVSLFHRPGNHMSANKTQHI